jgi:hypothetical protein
MWWLPAHEDEAVAGILVIESDDFPRLELIGALRPMQRLSEDFAPDIILGVAGGALVTLYRCVCTGSNFQIPGQYTEKYIGHFVLRGVHVAHAEHILFDKMQHRYDALFEWAGITGIKTESQTNAQGHLTRIEATYGFPETPTFQVDRAVIRLIPAVQTDGLRTDHFTVSESLSIEVVADTPLSLEAYLVNYFHDIANFLSLGVGGPVQIEEVSAELHSENEPSQQNRPQRVEITFLSRGRHVTKTRNRWDMLFTLRDLGQSAERAFALWLQRANDLRPVYDLYFGTIFQEGAYLHQRFLSLAQALESYHRRAYGGTHLAADKFSSVLSDLLAVVNLEAHAINRDVRNAFSNKLKYLNEVSLRKRLKDLFRDRHELASLLIRNEGRFIDRVVNTRNYYTHYDEDAREGAVEERNLLSLTDQMQFLLELCLLGELGLSDEIIRQLIARHQRYLGLRRVLATFDPAG